jgi:hypothetical protein
MTWTNSAVVMDVDGVECSRSKLSAGRVAFKSES